MIFEKIVLDDQSKIMELSEFATEIVREHFDPIIGKEQNNYMLQKFQTAEAITGQLEQGYHYYVIYDDDKHKIGFLAFCEREQELYLSKFYLQKEQRGYGYAKEMLSFVINHTKDIGLKMIVLNVNRDNPAIHAYEHLGFQKIAEEKNDIGNGFFMDDYVFAYYLDY